MRGRINPHLALEPRPNRRVFFAVGAALCCKDATADKNLRMGTLSQPVSESGDGKILAPDLFRHGEGFGNRGRHSPTAHTKRPRLPLPLAPRGCQHNRKPGQVCLA